ncbi:LacI family transcriptional regulator [Halanaerobium saccharolyticum]|uniref:LacI family transcriptional regulator n=1 Tax=Halanaerobium saccharolyticum TaxID=43595 RepID=A0A4R7YZ21_9FIRM|nr:LacI family DNA-binding transcriptional regulator [Halanaerobium saccharolyticum]RAK08458.1 LacI family transcriptional regulator [Halanaerobium saccharolyticum]TDW03507.1 LacI family transcriptional regulator [Halanaerobium saccharolyticum]TDX59950.1 LacI family transcriptional regulator [Halanaerobium saccharolyticum]
MTTQKDVAEKAGVTVTTVSRVINDRGYIAEETKNKVFQVMEELNYRPNAVARSLTKQKSNVLGVILPTVNHPFFSSLLSYLEEFAYQQDYKIMLCNSRLEAEKEKDYFNMLRAQQVDGIFLASHTLDIASEMKIDLPVITFDRKIEGLPYICADNKKGGRLAAEHLLARGAKRLAYIGGSLELDLLSNQRYQIFKEKAAAAGVRVQNYQCQLDSFDRREYQQLAAQIFSEKKEVDGIFAGSDLIAAAVIKEAQKNRIRVPEDLKVLGYDDLELACLYNPEITTIRQPTAEIAREAVEQLLKAVNGEEHQQKNILDVELIVREST